MSFAERFPNRDRKPSFVERVRPARNSTLLPMFEPLPPHSVHTPAPRDEQPTTKGEKGKARDILAAIRTLKDVERAGGVPTTDQRDILARFGGFGPVALSIFPDPAKGTYKDGWKGIGEDLEAILTPEEYNSAKRTTFSQFFTSPAVMDAMHEALKRLGVAEDATVLEPGCGTGSFMSGAHRYVGIEMDSITGRIARALHPRADIRVENFRDTKLPALDAVIGNVPFGDIKLDLHGQKLSLHDYFIAKSVDALKPGGVLAVVTSHYTLDKQNAAARELIGSKADFLGAIRLPSNAFKGEGTEVVTDIVFLRKRAPGQEAKHADADWLHVAPLQVEGAAVPINRYFLNHPEMVLGTWSRKDTLYGTDGFSVISNGDLRSQLKEAVARLPPPARTHPQKTPEDHSDSHGSTGALIDSKPNFTPPPPERHVTEGSFFVGDDKVIRQVQDGQGEPVTYSGTLLRADGTPQARRIGELIGLRDKARNVLRSQNEGWPEANRNGERAALRAAYDRFVSQHGPINKTTFTHTKNDGTIRRMPNLVKFKEDPDAMLVMALEDYDEATGKAEKAAIMLRDVVGPKPPVSRVSSAEEGLLISLDQRGGVDLPFIHQLYGKAGEAIVAELGDLIYRDPTEGWQTADQYLSGNVRAKLAAVRSKGPLFQRNRDALLAVQPEDVLPGDIDANLGAPWIPSADIKAFAEETFGGPVGIGHLKKDALWSVEASHLATQSVASTADYGTPRISGVDLFELALNLKAPAIYDPGPGDTRVLNPEATMAAKEKQKLVKERFKAWVFDEPDRTERLVRIYNDTYNNLRARAFDGSHLEFPGKSRAITLRPHQEDAVWRCMSGGNTLLAHAVGAGKTIAMCASAMKMRQAGLAQKPMLVVPNHMLEQFSREFMQLYPNAKLLVAGKEDFTRDRRKALTAKIATGDWDAVIVTHSGFERIGMSRDYQERFLREQIAEYESLLVSCAGEGRNIIKQVEKGKARREERLHDLLAAEKKDDGLVFDELGVDQIFIDEFQYFKNLEAPTKMDRVAGISTGGSERAFDVFMKARYLDEKHPGRGLVGASGTPISNSMVEMFTMQRFFEPKGLEERGIDHLDGWAATFGEVVDTMEISPDGSTLKPRSRFAKFINLPELTQMFRSFSDVQTAEMLNLPAPDLEGGKARTISCPMSAEQAELQANLVRRYERIRNQRVDPREDNALNITTDGRKLALDARMLSPLAEDFPGSKINALAANVARIHRDTQANRSTQMIFCDMGVNAKPFSAYDEVVRKLETAGIPPREIAVMGDADTDAKKAALFEKVRAGSVRVLIGSTAKMGTGTNVQKRLIALHHLDAPWKPAEVEQREGRILRQGNMNKQVSIFRYVTEGSFDAYMWQALETKARFIAQVMRGDCGSRSAEDIGGQELSYAEVKAIASGNPAVLTLAVADADIQRLAILGRNHADEQYVARRNIRDLPGSIDRLERRASALAEDSATAEKGKTDTQEQFARRLERIPAEVDRAREFPLGTYRGLDLGFVLYPSGGGEVTLDGATRRQTHAGSQGVRAVLNAAERIVDTYGAQRVEAVREAEVMKGKLEDYRQRLGRPFAHEAYLSQLTDLRGKLRVALSDKPPEGSPPSAEIAEQIKAMRESVTVEEAPKRASRAAMAEVPVTARIRLKPVEVAPEAVSQPDPKIETISSPTPLPTPKPLILPHVPESSFRQKVGRGQPGNGQQMRLW